MSNSCILCLENDSRPLIQNEFCECKYYMHRDCWFRYIDKIPIKCPMCRKEILTVVMIRQSAPPI